MIFPFACNFIARTLRYVCLAGIWVAMSTATGSEPVGDITLSQVVALALQKNPDLAVSNYELKAAAARITQAGLRPNPELTVEVENFAGTGAAKDTKVLETTLSLSQVIEMGGARNHRIVAATLERELTDITRQAQQLDVLASVTQRFIEVAAAQEHLVQARRATDLAQSTLSAINARVQAARTPEAEGSRARIAFTRAQIEQRQAESRLQTARYALAVLWGSAEPQFGTARADLYTLEPVVSLQSLQSRLQQNPYFLSFATTHRVRDAELLLARAQARPSLNFSLGVRRFEDSGNGALVAGFSMPLPIFNKNQGAIREAEVRRDQIQAQSHSASLQAQATLFGLYQQLLAAHSQVEALRNEAIPQADAALVQTRYGYNRGRFSYLELSAAQ